MGLMIVEVDGRAKAAMAAPVSDKIGARSPGGLRAKFKVKGNCCMQLKFFGHLGFFLFYTRCLEESNANFQMLCGALEMVCLTTFSSPSLIGDWSQKRDNSCTNRSKEP
jgi:hypothetical protein